MRQIIFHIFNLPWHIAEHVFGEDHTPKHRSIIGAILIVIGILVMRDHSLASDAVGSTLHGIGIIPVAEHLHLATKDRKKKLKYNNKPQRGTNRRATKQPCLQCVP